MGYYRFIASTSKEETVKTLAASLNINIGIICSRAFKTLFEASISSKDQQNHLNKALQNSGITIN